MHELTAAIHELQSVEFCGRGSLVARSPDGEQIIIVPFFCKSWKCKPCAVRLTERWRARIHLAHPERFITLTWDVRNEQDPVEAYSTMKEQFPKLVRLIRKRFGQFEYVLIWEWTLRGYPHIHILQKGCYLPQKWLSKAWSHLGCGEVVFIKDVSSAKHINKYITKYLTKNGHLTAMTLPFGRLIQASQHFFDDIPQEKPENLYDDWQWIYTPLSYQDAFDYLILDCKLNFEDLDEQHQCRLRVTEQSKIPPYPDMSQIIVISFCLGVVPGNSVTG